MSEFIERKLISLQLGKTVFRHQLLLKRELLSQDRKTQYCLSNLTKFCRERERGLNIKVTKIKANTLKRVKNEQASKNRN